MTTLLLLILIAIFIGYILEYFILKAHDDWKDLYKIKKKTMPKDFYSTSSLLRAKRSRESEDKVSADVKTTKSKDISVGTKSLGTLFDFGDNTEFEDDNDIPW